MLKPRVIPVLLLRHRGLVKTVQFKNPTYLGDPINIVRIFNDKEVDELVFLDIAATVEDKQPPFDLLARITDECFMPLSYGGGIRSLEDARRLYSLGVEKIVVNTQAVQNPSLIRTVADYAGSQGIVAAIDVWKNREGRYELFTHSGTKATRSDPVKFAVEMEKQGAGEILLTSIDRDGTMRGYDLDLIKQVTSAVNVPVVACGGAGKIDDLADAVKKGGASAAAAGSIFVFQGPHRAVLISYPKPQILNEIFS